MWLKVMYYKIFMVELSAFRRIVKADLGMKPFKILHRHLISQGSKARRQDRTKKMLQAMRSAGVRVFIWSDEKIFMVEPQVIPRMTGFWQQVLTQ